MRRIVFTGGGTGGHIIPNIALIKKIRQKYPDIRILYLGSKQGPEARMIPPMNIPFKSVATGKLRRYFSLQNIIDIFKIPFGILQSFIALKRFKPHAVFSKGGYVSVPVMIAARMLKIPTILHESDITPGLANRLCAKRASVLCLSHFESQRFFTHHKNKVVTGNPVRERILNGDKEKAYVATGFSKHIPTILVMGGSQGARHINKEIALAANELAKHYQIIHITGKGKLPEALPISEQYRSRYKAYEYVDKNLPHFYAITDVIIARSGANTLAEIDALNIPAILIPIGKNASRGEQLLNAFAYQESHEDTLVIEDELLTYRKLIKAIKTILPWDSFESSQRKHNAHSKGTEKILHVLDNYLGDSCLSKEQKC